MSCLHRSDCYVTLTFAHSRVSATSILKSDEISHWNFLAEIMQQSKCGNHKSIVLPQFFCFLITCHEEWRGVKQDHQQGVDRGRSALGCASRICSCVLLSLYKEKLILEVLWPFRKSLYCALPPLFRMLHSGHQQSRQLEQNNRLGVVCGGVGGSRVSSLDASKSLSETIKLTPDLHYSLWPDMIIMFLVLIGVPTRNPRPKIPTHLPIQPFTNDHQIAEERVPDRRFNARLQRFW